MILYYSIAAKAVFSRLHVFRRFIEYFHLIIIALLLKYGRARDVPEKYVRQSPLFIILPCKGLIQRHNQDNIMPSLTHAQIHYIIIIIRD